MKRPFKRGRTTFTYLAVALLGSPELLVLDEPTVGLDPAQIIEIRALIRGLAAERTVIQERVPPGAATCRHINGEIGKFGDSYQINLKVLSSSRAVLRGEAHAVRYAAGFAGPETSASGTRPLDDFADLLLRR